MLVSSSIRKLAPTSVISVSAVPSLPLSLFQWLGNQSIKSFPFSSIISPLCLLALEGEAGGQGLTCQPLNCPHGCSVFAGLVLFALFNREAFLYLLFYSQAQVLGMQNTWRYSLILFRFKRKWWWSCAENEGFFFLFLRFCFICFCLSFVSSSFRWYIRHCFYLPRNL